MKNRLLEQIPELTRVSSKGQLVIPSDIRMRLRIKEGDVFATMSADHSLIILKKIKNPLLKKDLLLLSEVGKAWEEIERRRCKTMGKKDFLKELKKW